jgi:GH24 family phage-related lysozyme (muramidase)
MAQHILDVQFPDENPRGAPGGDYQQISSNPSMFGATTARAQEMFGQGVEKAGITGIDIATEQQEIQNKVRLTDRKSVFADRLSDMHAGMMSLEGHAALSAYPDYKEKSAQLLKETVDSVDGPKQKAMLGEALTNIQDQYWRVWGGHAAGQEKTYQNRVASDAIASNSARASNLLIGGDERGAERALREQDAEVHNFFDGQGYDRDASEVEAQKRRGTTLRIAIETVAAGGDVAKAQSLFDKYKDRMDPTSVLQVTANLKSGVAQLQGRNLADEESGHAQPNAEAVAGVPSSFVAQVKRSEGFSPAAKWDVKQFSSGYGTRANFEGETISKEEADRRFSVEFAKAARVVDSVNGTLDPGTKAALTSLSYNAGSDWVRSGLGDAVRAGDLDKAKSLFLQYNKAGGETNEGLANRRYREAQWFGSAEAPASNGPLVDKQTAYERVLARTDNNPLLQTAAMARLNQVYGIYHAEQTAQHASFDQKLADTQAEAMATGTARTPLMEPDFVNRYGATEGQRQYGEYQKNLALGSDIAGLSTMSPDEQNEVLARHTPQPGSPGFEAEQTRQQAVAKAIQHSNKERDDDPAAFALRRLPAAQSAYADFDKVVGDKDAAPADRTAAAARFANVTLAEQARVGVPPQQRAILTGSQVTSIGGAINAAATSDDPVARQNVIPLIKQEAELWGNNWPQVAQQILPNAAPIVKAIAAGADPDAMLRVLSIPKGEDPAKIVKEQNEVTARNMHNALNVAMAPFLNSMVGLQKDRDYKGYFDVAEKLAALYVRDGKGAEEAAQSAFDNIVGKRYTFADTYRIPKSPVIDADAVQRGAYEARAAIQRVNGDDPSSPLAHIQPQINDIGISDNEADSRRNYARNGVFVTSPKNDGLNIAYNKTFLKGADGQPILLTWAQLQKMGGSKEARAGETSRAVLNSEQSP